MVVCRQKENSTQKGIGQYSSSYENTDKQAIEICTRSMRRNVYDLLSVRATIVSDSIVVVTLTLLLLSMHTNPIMDTDRVS